MNFRVPLINATTGRLIILTIASAFLLAAGDVTTATRQDVSQDVSAAGPTISDDILAPMTTAERAESAAALAATTPADVTADAPQAAEKPVRSAALSTLVASMDDVDEAVASDRDLRCLASAVYFESRGEPLEGQLAVAQAILNRAESGRYAGTACGVIAQPRQFSFDRTRAPRAGSDWQTAMAIAMIASENMWRAVAPGAMSFHANYVSPNWQGKTRVTQIGRHIFYR